MGKFRSKLKGKTKGKRWQKGQSSNSNPKTHKYRDMAKARFFQENLGSSGLTEQAINKHNTIIAYGHKSQKMHTKKSEAEDVLTVAKDLENMSVRTEDCSESQNSGSTKSGTVKTFASNFTKCSNVSFSKLLNRFDNANPIHKDMLVVLAAVAEVIKEQGGTETSTEYFAALMVTLKSAKTQESIVATLALLAMGIKTVSIPVLRHQFSDSATIFTDILEQNAQSENKSLLRSTIGCLSVLLRAQQFSAWSESSTMRVFDSVLAFTLHSNSKVRKGAQYAIVAILKKSCFMLPEHCKDQVPPKVHPAAHRVAEYCVSQIKAESLLSGHKSALHTLNMIREVLPVCKKDDIKATSEAMLSLMTHNNIYIKTNCLHAFHDLFAAKENNLPGGLAVQIVRALMAARPPANDHGQILSWAAVVEKGCCYLANVDLNLCMSNLPAFVNICVQELWLSDNQEINSAATSSLKAILQDCVKPALESDNFPKYKNQVDTIFKAIGTGLDNPFNQAIKYVILAIADCFEVANEKVAYVLGPLLKKLIERRESHNFHNEKEVEYATGKAVKALGPEFVLTNVPLKISDGINLDRSWLLPVLKEKISNAHIKYFATEILEMATFCRKKSRELTALNDVPGSHTYELLCNQLWSLWPSFCNYPRDIKDNFKVVARVLGNVLKDNLEFRLSIMQGLRMLIGSSEGDDKVELGRFAKNYIPILLNMYMSPAKGSTAVGQRLAALETIQVYLTISDQKLRDELFENALLQIEKPVENHFQREAILDIIRILIIYQKSDRITYVFDLWWEHLGVLSEEIKNFKAKNDKKNGEEPMEEGTKEDQKKQMSRKEKVRLLEMELKKAYRALEEVFDSKSDNCVEYVTNNYKKMKKMLSSSLEKVSDSSKAARLRCIGHLINRSPFVNAESKIVKLAIAEAVICTKGINSKCRQCAYELMNTIGQVIKTQAGGIQPFLSLILVGLPSGVPRLVSATLRALSSVVYNFIDDLDLDTIQGLLEKVADLMLSSNREIVSGALSFVKVYTKVVPTEALAGSLPLIIKTLSSMQEDCKRHSRAEMKYFLTRLARKYGAETIEGLVPGDESMLKQLRNIRKGINRKKRRDKERDNEQNDYEKDTIKGTSKSIDDILQDSDSDMDFIEDEDPRPKAKKAKGKNQAWIEEDADNIVDLADVSAARKITATDPSLKKKTIEIKQKKKDGGFKTAADGRLIITDDTDNDDDDDGAKPSGDIDSDSDDTDGESNEKKSSKPSKLLKTGAKRRYDDILSIKSGKSNKSRASNITAASKYKAGGKGIHRPLGAAASIASTSGGDYKSKKAKGDVKKIGKHDPYAYLPLSRKHLNKRTKATNIQQFKGIIKAKNRNKLKGAKKSRK